MPPSVAIIGGGLAGTASLAAMAGQLATGSRVTVFDREGLFGPGTTYHPDHPPYFQLNHEADFMEGLGIATDSPGPRGGCECRFFPLGAGLS